MDDTQEMVLARNPAAVARPSTCRTSNGQLEVVRNRPFEAPPMLRLLESWASLPTLSQVSMDIGRLIAESRRRRCPLALIYLDLDGFRSLSAAHGRALADDVIQFAASKVRHVNSPNAVIMRRGIDGFVMVITELPGAADTAASIQQILDAIAVPRHLGEGTLRVTASAGIAMFPKDGEDVATLSRNARAALRESKATRPGGLRFHSQNVAVIAKRRLRLEMDLRGAIENNELTLHYQPQFEVATGAVCGVEVLTRWFRSDGSAVEPGIFIPLAEQTRLIGQLGTWVLQHACTTARDWKSSHTKLLMLCVNVSPLQIDENFAAKIRLALQLTGFPASQLELEITESALVSNTSVIVKCFRQLKEIGVRIAIDDFGTGYSSLNYLSRLPVDRLKLDKSLVHNLTTRWRDVAILRSIIGLGKELGVTVIAEGVETEQQFKVLKELGCQQVQGYLLARPVAPQDALALLEKRWGMRHASGAATHAVLERSHEV
jgi:diguanylate cyclase (GGDEF)-like protein